MKLLIRLFALSVCFGLNTILSVGQIKNSEMKNIIDNNYNEYYNLYTHLHQNPELSFQEINTAKRMAYELKKAGFEVTENFAGNSLVGVFKNGEGPTLLIRTDMDALPLEEKTGLSYCSKVKMQDLDGEELPVMHACGHDMHMTVFIGTANTLVKLKNKWKGTLVFIAQQAEERSGGAKLMIKSGLFSKFPTPDYCLALHVSAEIEAGKVGIKPGAFFASTDMVDITVYGKGGHGAIPQNAIDPIVLSARMIMAFQTIVSREISPIETALITVGSIHGGTKHNIIPDKVDLELTVRTYNDETRNKVLDGLKRISKGIAISAGLSEDKFPTVVVRDESAPSVFNNPELTNRLESKFVDVLGRENVLQVPSVMAAEDFAIYGKTDENIPICLFWLGTVSKGKIAKKQSGNYDLPGLHSSLFAPEPEISIKTGINVMSSAAIHLLSK